MVLNNGKHQRMIGGEYDEWMNDWKKQWLAEEQNEMLRGDLPEQWENKYDLEAKWENYIRGIVNKTA